MAPPLWNQKSWPTRTTEFWKRSFVASDLWKTFFTQEEDLNSSPNLVERLEQLSPIRREFPLRKDVWFHNGSLLKTEDVVFSLHRAIEISSSVRLQINSFGSIASIDAFCFQIILNKLNPLLLVQLAQINFVSEFWIVEWFVTEIYTSSENHFYETNETGPFKLNQIKNKTL
jgi:MarR-like DNA-binding transcriptional regulator SgrR of sgrS sRNA